MDNFESIIKAFKDSEETKSQQALALVARERQEREDLQEEFLQISEVLVKPCFENFKAQLDRNGFHAEIKQEAGGADCPSISVEFFPDPNETADIHKSVFVIKLNSQSMRVEYSSLYDQRPRAAEALVKNQAIQSMNAKSVDQALEAFLTQALNSRKKTR